MDFSSCMHRPRIVEYLPCIQIRGYNFICLACDIEGFTTDLIGWKDENNYHGFYSTVNNVLVTPIEGVVQHPIFSIAKYWWWRKKMMQTRNYTVTNDD